MRGPRQCYSQVCAGTWWTDLLVELLYDRVSDLVVGILWLWRTWSNEAYFWRFHSLHVHDMF